MSKKTLNKSNLEALGADRLSDLLLEVSSGSADIKRRLRLELSHNLGTADLAHEVGKRLIALRKARGFIGWRKRKGLIKDLRTQVAMITEKIAPDDPALAFDLLWQFVDLAASIHARVDDSKGEVGAVFRDAVGHFKNIAPHALLDPQVLADRLWAALQGNGHGEWDGIITLMVPTLGDVGISRLRANIAVFASQPMNHESNDHEAVQFLRLLRGGSSYVADRKAQFVKACLQEIATATGDIDAYIAQFTEQDRQRKDVASEVAMLMLTQDRAADALTILQEADPAEPSSEAWDDASIATLSAVGRIDDAQAHRWSSFLESLNPRLLRDYLKNLPDFEDVEAEDRAKEHVRAFPSISAALNFCLNWPDLITAAQLISDRMDEINGAHYFYLTPAAEALRDRHPLAAVTIWRAMIDDTLNNARIQRYGYAAEHLVDCIAVDDQIADYGTLPTHDEYLARLRTGHDRKASFWAKIR